MHPRIVEVRHIRDYRVELGFSNGQRVELDFRGRVSGRGGVLMALEDVDFFSQVRVDSEAGTLLWPNGVDFCPDVLYSEATGTLLPGVQVAKTESK